MRPQKLSEVVGQQHLIHESGLLPRLIRSNQFGSIFFYGPPGCGKTTLAEVIAAETGAKCVRLNAVMSNVAELRDVLKLARYEPGETILFIDEIHRFNKSQQDLLLPDVEAGNIRLIGATTHNPGFYINHPLLSRSHLFRLEPLSVEDLVRVMHRALDDIDRGLGASGVCAEADALEVLARMADGDMRRALNALETIALALPLKGSIDAAAVETFAQERQIRYDAQEDEHYNTASAFIKSIRGGDPDAALYWLAKMLMGGEDPRFIARRLVIFASEDVGLADSRALGVAVAGMQACEFVGLPECELNLAHVTTFLTLCPKSNSTTCAIGRAKEAIRKGPVQKVPLWLQDAHTQVNKSMGQGAGYLYSHEFPQAISGQEFMLDPLPLYEPKAVGSEAGLAERLERWKALKKQIQERGD